MSMCSKCAAADHLEGRKCAFRSGVFDTDNWNCEGLYTLRSDAYRREVVVYSEDNNACLVPFEGRFLFLGWYKGRGRVDELRFMDVDEPIILAPVTLEQMEEVLRYMRL